MRIVLLGAPGSGKGTMAQKLTHELSLPQISTGDIFRQNLKDETPLGLQIKDIMAKGMLVPDEITIEIVKDRLAKPDCANGYILDGFPRSIVQAEALDTFQQIDCAVNLEVDSEAIVKRLSGRRFCPDCNGTYVREDDKEHTVRNRLSVYEQTTLPLVDYYARQGKLVTVDGNGTVDEVYGRILSALKK